MKIAETFGECVNVLDNGPLTNENFDLFYTELPDKFRTDITQQLNFRLKYPMPNTFKFLLAGHRGVGKSTELLRVSKLCSNYETIFINVSDALGDKKVEYTNLLILITNSIMDFGISKHLIGQDDESLTPLMEYWETEVQYSKILSSAHSNMRGTSAEAELKGKVSTKFDLLKMLKTTLSIGVKAGGSFSYNRERSSTVDEIIHTVISKNNSLYIDALNYLIDKIKRQMTDKRLLLIVQELDRDANLTLAKNVFKDKLDAFIDINADMIYTYPVHLLYDPGYSHVRDKFSDIFQLGVVEIIDENRHYLPEGIALFKELVYKRIKKELIEERALELVIEISGGLIRDVFSMIIVATMNAAISDHSVIGFDDVNKAIRNLEEHYIKLLDIDDAFNKLQAIAANPYQMITADLRNFLRTECVLEYRDNRYMVHPVVIKFLKRIGYRVNDYGEL